MTGLIFHLLEHSSVHIVHAKFSHDENFDRACSRQNKTVAFAITYFVFIVRNTVRRLDDGLVFYIL
jgi:hypothetical protein